MNPDRRRNNHHDDEKQQQECTGTDGADDEEEDPRRLRLGPDSNNNHDKVAEETTDDATAVANDTSTRGEEETGNVNFAVNKQQVKQELHYLDQQRQGMGENRDAEEGGDYLDDIMPLPMMSSNSQRRRHLINDDDVDSFPSSSCDMIQYLKSLRPEDRTDLEMATIRASQRGDGNPGAYATSAFYHNPNTNHHYDNSNHHHSNNGNNREEGHGPYGPNDDDDDGDEDEYLTLQPLGLHFQIQQQQQQQQQPIQDEALVQARAVNDDAFMEVAAIAMTLQEAEPGGLSPNNSNIGGQDTAGQGMDSKEPITKQRQRLAMFVVFCTIIIILVSVALLILLNDSEKDNYPKTNKLSINITTLSPHDESTLLPLPDFTWDAILDDNNSPQALAYQWLSQDPNLPDMSESQRIQRMALATLYFATNGSQWTINQDWLSYNQHECNWFSKVNATMDAGEAGSGTPLDFFLFIINNQSSDNAEYDIQQSVCNENGNYKALVMSSNELQGPIPPEMALLSNLELLDITDNPLHGSLPSHLGLLNNLRELNLGRTLLGTSNYLSGIIPSTIGMLTNLEYFYAIDADFTGTLPSELGNLKKMRQFTLSASHKNPKLVPGSFTWEDFIVSGNGRGITGTIPPEIYQWTHLKHIHLFGNDLIGSISSHIGRLTALQTFVVSGNGLTGSLPKEIFSLSKLASLNLSMNLLSGTIATEVGNLSQLKQLYLGMGNAISGTIPSELGLCTELAGLSMSYTMLSGAVPQELFQMTSLAYLNFGDNFNMIAGSIPSELCLATNMKRLMLSNSNFIGSLPSCLDAITTLEHLDLQGNQLLTGSFPFTSFLNSKYTTIQINNTGLTGTLPDAACGARSLWFDCPQLCGCACPCN